MSYTNTDGMFRSLDDAEEEAFRQYARQYARDNDPPNLAHWNIYHPVCRIIWIERGIQPPSDPLSPGAAIVDAMIEYIDSGEPA